MMRRDVPSPTRHTCTWEVNGEIEGDGGREGEQMGGRGNLKMGGFVG